jgi:hypothetical protein
MCDTDRGVFEKISKQFLKYFLGIELVKVICKINVIYPFIGISLLLLLLLLLRLLLLCSEVRSTDSIIKIVEGFLTHAPLIGQIFTLTRARANQNGLLRVPDPFAPIRAHQLGLLKIPNFLARVRAH